MKQKHLLSLLQGGFTTIRVAFADDVPTNSPIAAPPPPMPGAPRWAQAPSAPAPAYQPRLYTYKAPLADNVKPGDAIIVDSPRNGLRIVTVAEVDPTPRIDVDADFDYKWIVQKVDLTAYMARLTEEQNFSDTLQEVERIKQRELLMRTMTENLPEGSQARAAFDAAIAAVATPIAVAAPVRRDDTTPTDSQIAAGSFDDGEHVGMACK